MAKYIKIIPYKANTRTSIKWNLLTSATTVYWVGQKVYYCFSAYLIILNTIKNSVWTIWDKEWTIRSINKKETKWRKIMHCWIQRSILKMPTLSNYQSFSKFIYKHICNTYIHSSSKMSSILYKRNLTKWSSSLCGFLKMKILWEE